LDTAATSKSDVMGSITDMSSAFPPASFQQQLATVGLDMHDEAA